MSFILAIDIGTTAVKFIGFSLDGQLVHRMETAYTLCVPELHFCEQDPENIFRSVLLGYQKIIDRYGDPEAVVFSSAMHSLILMDGTGAPLTPLITWADNRSHRQVAQLQQDGLAEAYHQRTGTPVHPMSLLPKILWFKQEREQLFTKADKFISIKEFIIFRLFGSYLIDESVASATGLFNIHTRAWDDEILDHIGIKKEQLSEVVPVTYQILNRSKFTGEPGSNIKSGIPVVIGGSDGCLANLGCGAIKEDIAAVTIGTSAAIRIATKKPVIAEGNFCYILDQDHYICGGAMNNAGIAIDWAIKTFTETSQKDPYQHLDTLLKSIPAGSDGLICLPYLLGERAPVWDPFARSAFVGVTIRHSRQHFFKALVEGILLNIYQISQNLQKYGINPKKIMVGGGVARSEHILSMMACIFNKPVKSISFHDNSAYGAYILALLSLNKISKLEDYWSQQVTLQYQPDVEKHRQYLAIFSIYSGLYEKLKEDFVKINNLRNIV